MELIDREKIEWYGCNFETPECESENRKCSECSHAECSHAQVMQLPSIKVPDNPTNGDIFTSIYKPYKVKKHTLCVSIYRTEHDFKQGIEWLVFVSNWWDAPYKEKN